MKKSNFIINIFIAFAIGTTAYLIFDNFLTIWKVKNQKINNAKQNCGTIVQGAKKFNFLYGRMPNDYKELKNTLFTGIDTLKDPWGNLYIIDPEKYLVISKGPDEILNTPDDVSESYFELNTLFKAEIEINPNNYLETSKIYDVLHLYFNRDVLIPNNKIISLKDCVNPNSTNLNKTFIFYETFDSKILLYDELYKKSIDHIISSKIYFNENFPDIIQFANDGNIYKPSKTGLYYWGKSSNEIAIKFPDGVYNIFTSGCDHINLIGNEANPNKTFIEMLKTNDLDNRKTIIKVKEGLGAKSNIYPITIGNYNKNIDENYIKIVEKQIGLNIRELYLNNDIQKYNNNGFLDWRYELIYDRNNPNDPNYQLYSNIKTEIQIDYKYEIQITYSIANFKSINRAIEAIKPKNNKMCIVETIDNTKFYKINKNDNLIITFALSTYAFELSIIKTNNTEIDHNNELYIYELLKILINNIKKQIN
ncbi:MAG: hypothetical protein GYA62_06180 [Bacteroidales bacterium]|nr:hypothetical protein [Bacteroidales bacterium]